MKVLITGGAGYFGGALSKALIKEGYFVRILDLQYTKYVPSEAEFVYGDVRNITDVEKVLEDIDVVYHLAFVQTPSDLPAGLQFQVNVVGTRNLLNSSIGRKLRRFVFVSTIEVYGSKPVVPITENSLLDPVGLYSIHKIECESLCVTYSNLYNVPCTIARLPIICGQGYYNHKPFLAMLDRVIENKFVFLPAPGDVLADMIHIDDAIEALNLLVSSDNALGETFHFSASKPATQLDIAKMIIDVSGSKSKVIFIPKQLVRLLGWIILLLHIYRFPPEQIDYLLNDFVCDNSKAKRMLGFAPKYSVLEAMKALVVGYMSDRDYIRNRRIGDVLKSTGGRK